MVEERNLTTTDNTPDATRTDTAAAADPTKEELHQRMEQARDSISNTVAEIKDTVTNKVEKISSDISRTLDWREHVNRNPLAFNLGALALGFAAGAMLLGAGTSTHGRSSHHLAASGDSEMPDLTPEPEVKKVRKPRKAKQGPSLYEKVKETETFHRLQDEVMKMGDRFLDEIITVGNEVLLPAVVAKLREAVDELIPAEQSAPAQISSAKPTTSPNSSTESPNDSAPVGTEETLSQSKTNTL